MNSEPQNGIRHHCPLCGTPSKPHWSFDYNTKVLKIFVTEREAFWPLSRTGPVVGETTIYFPPVEADIFKEFAENAGLTLPREWLISRVWGKAAPPAGVDHLLSINIGEIRKRLKKAKGALAIGDIRGWGYVLLQKGPYEPMP